MNLIIVGTLLALYVTQTLGCECTCNCNCPSSCPGHGKYRLPEDCQDILDAGLSENGVHIIYPGDNIKAAVDVYCDQKTDGGGWTVFQRRMDGSEDFYRNWEDYQNGFGNTSGEYWLGLDTLARIIESKTYTLRIDLESFDNETKYAEYGTFFVGPATTSYTLIVGSYSGTAGDSLEYSNGQKFSTNDQDNDVYNGSCAKKFKGAWWYKACHRSNLNGHYFKTGITSSFADGVTWKSWKGQYYSMKSSEMKIRPSRKKNVDGQTC